MRPCRFLSELKGLDCSSHERPVQIGNYTHVNHHQETVSVALQQERRLLGDFIFDVDPR